jgi:hypothetical protein
VVDHDIDAAAVDALSTPGLSRAVAALLAGHGVGCVDAPVSGVSPEHRTRTLLEVIPPAAAPLPQRRSSSLGASSPGPFTRAFA